MMFSPSIFFYPRDAMLARSLPSKDVCLSVCPSHAGILSKRINLYFGPYGNPIIPVFLTPAPIPNSKGNPVSWGAKYTGWVGKFCNVRLKSPSISETVRD